MLRQALLLKIHNSPAQVLNDGFPTDGRHQICALREENQERGIQKWVDMPSMAFVFVVWILLPFLSLLDMPVGELHRRFGDFNPLWFLDWR